MTVQTEPAAARTAPSTTARPFWLVGAVVVTFLAAASAPTPLYSVLQEEWGFSALTLTTVFASYALALLVSLLTVGGLSDFLGRRPVLLAAMALEAVSLVLFLLADDVPVLVLARVVQGLATGAAIGVTGAALVDLQPAGTSLAGMLNAVGSTGGLAVGALGSGIVVQAWPGNTHLVFGILLVVVVVLALPVSRLPETVGRRPGALASLAPRLAVPRAARATFLTVSPIMVATWSMGALYLSLGPSVAGHVLGLTSHLVDAAVVSAFTGAGAVAAVLVRERPARPAMLVGATVLAAGTTVTVVGLQLPSVPLFLLGTVVAGAGFGAGFLGAFRLLVAQAEPAQRAELIAAVYVVSYLAFSIPAVVAGLLVPVLGLQETATWYAVIVIVLAGVLVVSAGAQRVTAARRR